MARATHDELLRRLAKANQAREKKKARKLNKLRRTGADKPKSKMALQTGGLMTGSLGGSDSADRGLGTKVNAKVKRSRKKAKGTITSIKLKPGALRTAIAKRAGVKLVEFKSRNAKKKSGGDNGAAARARASARAQKRADKKVMAKVAKARKSKSGKLKLSKSERARKTRIESDAMEEKGTKGTAGGFAFRNAFTTGNFNSPLAAGGAF